MIVSNTNLTLTVKELRRQICGVQRANSSRFRGTAIPCFYATPTFIILLTTPFL